MSAIKQACALNENKILLIKEKLQIKKNKSGGLNKKPFCYKKLRSELQLPENIFELDLSTVNFGFQESQLYAYTDNDQLYETGPFIETRRKCEIGFPEMDADEYDDSYFYYPLPGVIEQEMRMPLIQEEQSIRNRISEVEENINRIVSNYIPPVIPSRPQTPPILPRHRAYINSSPELPICPDFNLEPVRRRLSFESVENILINEQRSINSDISVDERQEEEIPNNEESIDSEHAFNQRHIEELNNRIENNDENEAMNEGLRQAFEEEELIPNINDIRPNHNIIDDIRPNYNMDSNNISLHENNIHLNVGNFGTINGEVKSIVNGSFGRNKVVLCINRLTNTFISIFNWTGFLPQLNDIVNVTGRVLQSLEIDYVRHRNDNNPLPRPQIIFGDNSQINISGSNQQNNISSNQQNNISSNQQNNQDIQINIEAEETVSIQNDDDNLSIAYYSDDYEANWIRNNLGTRDRVIKTCRCLVCWNDIPLDINTEICKKSLVDETGCKQIIACGRCSNTFRQQLNSVCPLCKNSRRNFINTLREYGSYIEPNKNIGTLKKWKLQDKEYQVLASRDLWPIYEFCLSNKNTLLDSIKCSSCSKYHPIPFYTNAVRTGLFCINGNCLSFVCSECKLNHRQNNNLPLSMPCHSCRTIMRPYVSLSNIEINRIQSMSVLVDWEKHLKDNHFNLNRNVTLSKKKQKKNRRNDN